MWQRLSSYLSKQSPWISLTNRATLYVDIVESAFSNLGMDGNEELSAVDKLDTALQFLEEAIFGIQLDHIASKWIDFRPRDT